MRKYILFVLTTAVFLAAKAHPGIGIVIDSHGNIFYSDLKQVWKLEPSGRRLVVVPRVHTHELSIDKNDNIYGEHTWYNGERLNTWGHYVWKRNPDGRVEKIKQDSPGFLDDYGFMPDKNGNVFWIQRFTESKFMKKSPDGRITMIASGRFHDIRWSYCTPSGVIYFVDLHRLYRLQDGKFLLLAENLDDSRPGFGFSRKHNVYGIWTDKTENIYVAIMSQKKVKRINKDGNIDVVTYSTGGWSPTGGVFDKDGNLWLLENSGTNNVRVRKISASELAVKPNIIRSSFGNFLLLAAGLMATCMVLVTGRKIIKWIKNVVNIRVRDTG